MRSVCIAAVAAVGLSGCWLLNDAPAVLKVLDEVAHQVLERTGKSMDDHVTHCEYENDPSTGTLLVLCTVCYDLAGGECK